MDDIVSHELNCPLRPYRCPVAGCDQKRILALMFSHLKLKHCISVCPKTGKSVSTLKKFVGTDSWRNVILLKDDIFIHMTEVIGNYLYTGVLHFGPGNKTPGLRYRVEISRADGSGRVSADRAVGNYMCGSDQFIAPGNFAGFSYKFAKSCVVEGNRLNMQVQISYFGT
jgi:hypothetical protein